MTTKDTKMKKENERGNKRENVREMVRKPKTESMDHSHPFKPPTQGLLIDKQGHVAA